MSRSRGFIRGSSDSTDHGAARPRLRRRASTIGPVVRRKEVGSRIGSLTARHYCPICGQKVRACECSQEDASS